MTRKGDKKEDQKEGKNEDEKVAKKEEKKVKVPIYIGVDLS